MKLRKRAIYIYNVNVNKAMGYFPIQDDCQLRGTYFPVLLAIIASANGLAPGRTLIFTSDGRLESIAR